MPSPTDSERSPFRNPPPLITYPEELPVSGKRLEIAHAIRSHQTIIVCGETGSGKTTQLPKICLELGRGKTGLIGHTQPRRIAASSTAKRIAQELGSPLGTHVGFTVRFTDTFKKGASIKLMTDGILLAETQSDPLLNRYDTIIIDEAHERSLNIDFLLGHLKQILPKRPDLKLIITSATIDANRFSQHFGLNGAPAPIIEVSGRLYPVEIQYRPIDLTCHPSSSSSAADATMLKEKKQRDWLDAIVDAVDELSHMGSGDILIFLAGEREIRETTHALRQHGLPHIDILPLFARLSAQEQEQIFKLNQTRRIILATNVAETSLTVPGIRYVIDTGLARIKRYSYRNKVEQLHIEPIAQSAANQRAGRCGRTSDGICIRLYSEQDYLSRPKFTEPEILRASLASVILRMKMLQLTDIDSFPFVDPPLKRAIADGYQLLNELGALEESNQAHPALTPLGLKLARLPLDPRIGRMILGALEQDCLTEILIIASALSTQDPRDRPLAAQATADQAHQKFYDPQSEFKSYLKIWAWFEEAIKHKKTNRQLQEQCRSQFLSQLRLREWRDIHSQLLNIVQEQNWRLNQTPATYEQLHIALLTGLLGNIGCKSDEHTQYLGARNIKFQVWPGSSLSKKSGRWIMASELVDTSRLYARCVAQIQPEWVEKTGAHLLKKTWGDPHWEKRSNQVFAYERATLYGLVLYQQRRIAYKKIDPKQARIIFIRDALVVGDFDTAAPFFKHNQKLVQDIQKLEHQARRPDILVDDQLIASFYEQHIPLDICDGISFEKWYAHEVKKTPSLLYINREELMRHEAQGITTDLFPKTLLCSGMDMNLSYHFELGSARDGVTLTIPLHALNQISEAQCSWLVPGMLKEKIHTLIKSLPQKIRRYCAPLPAYAEACCDRLHQPDIFRKGDLKDALIHDIREQTGLVTQYSDYRWETLPTHLIMNFKIVDEHGRQLEMSRNLSILRNELSQQARQEFQKVIQTHQHTHTQEYKTPTTAIQSNAEKTERHVTHDKKIYTWTIGVLPELLEIQKGTQTFIGFPALVDHETYCTLEVFDNPQEATQLHYSGLRRLFALEMKDSLKNFQKNIPNLQTMGMHFMPLGTQETLRDHIIQIGLNLAFLQPPLPTNTEQFQKRKEEGKNRLGLLIQEAARLIAQILQEYHGLPKKCPTTPAYASTNKDIQTQLHNLIHPRFILENSHEQLKHFPRYLKAIHIRLEKLRTDPERDKKLLAEWNQAALPWQRTLKEKREHSEINNFRWLLEELRVSLFAQELRTPMPISVKRLQKIWESNQK